MHSLKFNLFPGAKRKAVTFSYDDGKIYDKRLTEIFDKYGAKCTYNISARNIGKENYLDADFVCYLAEKHEVAIHGYSHPFLERLPVVDLMAECYEDKKELERIVKRPIIGMAYPFGSSDPDVLTALRALGIKYSRTTAETRQYGYPNDFLRWNPTCHHRNALNYLNGFINNKPHHALYVLYIRGHSHEFNDDGNWELMDEILAKLSECDDIWYATNGEIYDYYQAIKDLRIAADGVSVYNPSAVTVYATDSDKNTIVEIMPGFNKLQ
jgi:peptidoglycan/xylan/chitin deacetylase (PgdA/CDA1 family)